MIDEVFWPVVLRWARSRSTANSPWTWPDYYQRYRRSAKWKRTRAAKIASTNGHCESCGSEFNLEIHHLTYDRVGDELLSDLQVLCDLCHRSVVPHPDHRLDEDVPFPDPYARQMALKLEKLKVRDQAREAAKLAKAAARARSRAIARTYNP